MDNTESKKKWSPWADAVAARVAAMIAESGVINKTLLHNGLRGAAREAFVRNFLLPFLPPTIGVGTGEIINHLGNRSFQVDVVLYNKGMVAPALINGSDIGLFPWETVIAVIEVKSTLSAESCSDALANALSVHNVLDGVPEVEVLVGGEPLPANLRSLSPIPYYIFAFRSDLTSTREEGDALGVEANRLEQQAEACQKKYNRSKEACDLAEMKLSAEKQRLETLATVKSPVVGAKSTESVSEAQANLLKLTEERDAARRTSLSNEKLNGVRTSFIHGVCIPGREWTRRPFQFDTTFVGNINKMAFVRATAGQLLTFKNPAKESSQSQLLDEPVHFLNEILRLAHHMPEIRKMYELDRYLTWHDGYGGR